MPGWEQDVTAQLTSAPSGSDKVLVRDKSDTTDSSDGTDKDSTVDNLLGARSLTGGNAIDAIGDLSQDRTIAISTDGIQTDELDLTITPTWTGEHNFHGGISTSSGALNLSATTNTDQLVARTDGNVAMNNSLKVGGTGSPSQTLHVAGTFLVDEGVGGTIPTIRTQTTNVEGIELEHANAGESSYVIFDRRSGQFEVGTSGTNTNFGLNFISGRSGAAVHTFWDVDGVEQLRIEDDADVVFPNGRPHFTVTNTTDPRADTTADEWIEVETPNGTRYVQAYS